MAAVGLAAFCIGAQAADVEWIGGSGSWTSGANWSLGHPPVTGDLARFSVASGSYVVLVDTNPSLLGIVVSGSAAWTWTNAAATVTSGSFGFSYHNSSTGTWAVRLAGPGGLTVSNGLLVLSVSNAFSGVTSVGGGGTLRMASSGALGATSNVMVGAGGMLELAAGVGAVSRPLMLSGYGVASNGALRSSSGTNAWNGNVTLSADAGIGVAAGTLTVGGAISGPGQLTKLGAGQLTLNAANTFSGGMALAGGTVAINGENRLGVTDAPIFFQGSATLLGTANITLSAGRTVTIQTNAVAGFDGTVTWVVSGPIVGPGGLLKKGSGKLTLAGANTYSGGTTVSNGVLEIGNGGTAGTLPGDVVNFATLLFNRADAWTYAGSIGGTGAVIKAGAGAPIGLPKQSA